MKGLMIGRTKNKSRSILPQSAPYSDTVCQNFRDIKMYYSDIIELFVFNKIKHIQTNSVICNNVSMKID